MEVAGLAIGVASLTALFDTCLNLIDRVETYRDFERDSHYLATRFKAEKLRLEQWGHAVGLRPDGAAAGHHPVLDDPQALSTVRELLALIQDVSVDTNDRLPIQQSLGEVLPNAGGPAAANWKSKRRKLGWALGAKEKSEVRVEKLATLVSLLHDVVPADRAKDVFLIAQATPGKNSMIAQGSWALDFRLALSRIEEKIEAEMKEKIYKWLGSSSSGDLYEDSLRRRVKGTCDWILDKPAFQDWLSPDQSAGGAKMLWIHGSAGCGKTVLCAKIAEHLVSTSATPVAHFFLSSESEGRDDPYLAVRSWIAQIISSDTRAFDAVSQEFRGQHEQIASRATMVRLLKEVLQAAPSCTLILDGLDECTWMRQSQKWGESMTDFLDSILDAAATADARFLLVCRDEPEIRRSLDETDHMEVKISMEDVGADISLYAKSIVDKKLPRKDQSTREELAQRMAGRCKGQFLWLRMQAESLRGTKNKKQLESIIDEAPSRLGHLYERNWERILQLEYKDRTRAISLIRWAAFSIRPLTVSEITEAVLIDESSVEFPLDQMPDEIDEEYISDEIVGLCGSLLEVRSSSSSPLAPSKTVHIAHFSVKQFFLSHHHAQGGLISANEGLRYSNESLENTLLAELCLTYINYQYAWINPPKDHSSLMGGSFQAYAAGAWHQHTTLCSSTDVKLIGLIVSLFDELNPMWDLWATWFEHQLEGKESSAKPASPLYHASRLGLDAVVEILIQNPKSDINTLNKFGESPLCIACARGHEKVALALIEGGADINMPNESGCTPLYNAAVYGHARVVRLLYNNGADPTTRKKGGWTPLSASSAGGHIEVVKLLLDTKAKADVATPNDEGGLPLHMAAWNGHVQVVKLLLDHGADPSTPNGRDGTPLLFASNNGHIEIVKLLLETKAKGDISTPDDLGLVPVHAAAGNGHVEVVKLLLELGAMLDIMTLNKSGFLPLHSAAFNGHVEMVKLLLNKGADPRAPNSGGATPLNLASNNGHVEIVKIFLDSGAKADVSTPNKAGFMPLHAAALNGHIEVVKLLLDEGVDPRLPNSSGATPLNLASNNGHAEIVTLLLGTEAKANLMTPNKAGFMPLHAAAVNGHVEVIKLLLAQGIDPRVPNGGNATPLNLASNNGHVKIVEILLHTKAEADISTPNKTGWVPLHAAAANGHVEVIKVLLDKGASITVANCDNWTPLQSAARAGHVEVVKLLLDKGADIAATNISGSASIHGAAEGGHLSIVKLLLDKGASVATANNSCATPLHLAAGIGHIDIVKLLLDRGADMMAVNRQGNRPVYMAAANGHAEVVELFFDKGFDMAVTNQFGLTLAHFAAYSGRANVLQLLFDKGVDITVADSRGRLPAHMAAQRGHDEAARLLLDMGLVDPAHKDFLGRTMLSYAAYGGCEEATLHLVSASYGFDLNSSDTAGRTPLSLAAMVGHGKMAMALISNGADPNWKDHYGSTPLSLAVRSGHRELAEQLLAVADVACNTVDSFGRSTLWWAQRSGQSDLVQVVSERVGTSGLEPHNPKLSTGAHLAPHNPDSRWCDVCTLTVLAGDSYYQCNICLDGGFMMDLDCHKADAHCLDVSHTLVKKKDGAKIA